MRPRHNNRRPSGCPLPFSTYDEFVVDANRLAGSAFNWPVMFRCLAEILVPVAHEEAGSTAVADGYDPEAIMFDLKSQSPPSKGLRGRCTICSGNW
jgi:hypothetical protein